jgi:RimJ/RimL family protein N-acetyltransferase
MMGMDPRIFELKDGRTLQIREAVVEDAPAMIDYVNDVSGESDFLLFGPGEFELTEPEECEFIRKCLETDNQAMILGLIEDVIVSILHFTGGRRARIRHSGELGITVRKEFWRIEIGSLMMDALIDWAKATGIITKLNLRVRTDNKRAIRLYKRKGFVVEGTIRGEVRIDGESYDLHWMGLEL